MSTITNPLTAAANPSPLPASTPKPDALANESTFLKLLVSQLQHQDPLNPTDSNQFVSQLTAYSQLEQLIGINKNTAATTAGTAPVAANAANSTTTNSTTKTGS